MCCATLTGSKRWPSAKMGGRRPCARPPPALLARCSRQLAWRCRPTSATPAQPNHPARAVPCDANNHPRSRKRLNQNTFLKLGVQVELECVETTPERFISAAVDG